jgi:hypothetical protein
MPRNRLGFMGLLSPSAPCVFGLGNLRAHLRRHSHRSHTISAPPPSPFPLPPSLAEPRLRFPAAFRTFPGAVRYWSAIDHFGGVYTTCQALPKIYRLKSCA